jgi:hypothetical protein
MRTMVFSILVGLMAGCGDPSPQVNHFRTIDPSSIRHGVYSTPAGKFNPDGTRFTNESSVKFHLVD